MRGGDFSSNGEIEIETFHLKRVKDRSGGWKDASLEIRSCRNQHKQDQIK